MTTGNSHKLLPLSYSSNNDMAKRHVASKVSDTSPRTNNTKKISGSALELTKIFSDFFYKNDESSSTLTTVSTTSSSNNLVCNGKHSSIDLQDEYALHQNINNERFRQVQEEMRKAKVFTNAAARLLYESVLRDSDAKENLETRKEEQIHLRDITTTKRFSSKVKKTLLSLMTNFQEEIVASQQQVLDESSLSLDYTAPVNIQQLRRASHCTPSAFEECDCHDHRDSILRMCDEQKIKPNLKKYKGDSSLSLSSTTDLSFSIETGGLICDFKQACENSKLLICDFTKDMNESSSSLEDKHLSVRHRCEGDNDNSGGHHATRRKKSKKRSLVRQLSITVEQVETLIDNLDESRNGEQTTAVKEEKDLFSLMQEAGAIPCFEED